MNLNYRGIAYPVSSSALEMTGSEVIGTYRGAPLRRPRFNLPQRAAGGLELTFLGQRYCR